MVACDNEVLFDSLPECAIIAAVSATCIRLNAAAAAAINASSGEIYCIDVITSATLSSAEVTLATTTMTTEEASGVGVNEIGSICDEGLIGIGENEINIDDVINVGVCDGVKVIVGEGVVDGGAPGETVLVCVGVIVGVVDGVSVAVILELDESELVKVFIDEPLVILLPVTDKLAKFEPVKMADFCAGCDRVGALDLDNKLDIDDLTVPDDEDLDVLLLVIGE